MFELPRYQGIEEAIKDVQEHSIKTGNEAMIGLRKDGKRMWTEYGDKGSVAIPMEFRNRDNQGIFIVHSHPSVPTELSASDHMFTWEQRADGNLAVCEDGTISWSTGPRLHKKEGEVGTFLNRVEAKRWYDFLGAWQTILCKRIKPEGGWQDSISDASWTILSHYTNQCVQLADGLKDYHLHLGPKSEEAIGAWEGKLGNVFDEVMRGKLL